MRVSEVMSRNLVSLPTDASVAAGLDAAKEHDLHHVLVTADDKLVGIVCVCDLRERPRSDTLASCISRPPDVIAPEQSLDEAAETFVARGVSCFPVCDEGELVGVVTRGDLRRGMIPEAKLPASFQCTFCGSTRHVRPFHGDPALAACLECSDRSAPADSGLYEEGRKD